MKILFVVIAFFISGCSILDKTLTEVEREADNPELEKITTGLHWEHTDKEHPERAAWSKTLLASVDKNFAVYDSAKDIIKFCPKYKSLTHAQKLKAWGEFWVGVAYYESGYNPKSASVDVGKQNDINTWSVGIFQMSVTDQKNYQLPTKYTYNDLLTASPNIDVANRVMVRQIQKKGLLVVPSGIYWAVISGKPGSKYTHVNEIALRVQKYAGFCK